jgi:hypothetical protein
MKLKPLFLVAALAAAFSAKADTFQYRTFAKGVVAPKPGVELTGDTDFGSVVAGQTQTRTFTLSNTSPQASLRILDIEFDGDRLTRAAGGTCPTTFPGKLSANSSCTILGTWAPLSAGALTPASLTVTNDAPNSPHSLELTGTATPVPAAYAFTSHTFTNCTATGAFGPSLAQCKTEYSTAGWTANPEFFNVVNGIQYWTVPDTGTYEITAHGGGGGFAPTYSAGAAYGDQGQGVTATFTLNRGDILQLLVGQLGGTPVHVTNDTTGNRGGGGGASFIVRANTPLLVAAGGSGAPRVSNTPNTQRKGSGGFATDGVAGAAIPAKSFLNGGAGGQPMKVCTDKMTVADGGFGGGGAGDNCASEGGGGGGYTGGAAGAAVSYSAAGPVQTVPVLGYGRQGRIVITRK